MIEVLHLRRARVHAGSTSLILRSERAFWLQTSTGAAYIHVFRAGQPVAFWPRLGG